MKKPFCSLLFSNSSKNALRLPQFLLTFRRAFGQVIPELRRDKPNAGSLMTSLGCPTRCEFTWGTWVYPETYPISSRGNRPRARAVSPMPHLLWAVHTAAARPGTTELSKSDATLMDVGETMEEGDGLRGTRNITMCSCRKKSLLGGVI